jgi:hypothetical protein
MGSIALPIGVTHNVGGTKGDVGLIFSVYAFLEVLVMGTFVLRPSSPGNRGWISAGFAAFVLYFLAVNWAPSTAIFLIAQVLRAIAIGFTGYQGISCLRGTTITVLSPPFTAAKATLCPKLPLVAAITPFTSGAFRRSSAM